MKRNLCQQHLHNLKSIGKGIKLSTSDECSVCRWKARRLTLKDAAVRLRIIADNIEYAYNHPDYDPFGHSFMSDFSELINRFIKAINPYYRAGFIQQILKDIEEQSGGRHEKI